jgi:hypothetical protein
LLHLGIVAVVVEIEIVVELNNEFSQKRPKIKVFRFSQLKG